MTRAGLVRRLIGDEAGASAIEFALLAPFLIAGLLLMVDTGRAVGARMDMDRTVRAGAQAAMALSDAAAIRRIVLASAAAPETLAVSVDLACRCPGSAVACTTLCATGDAPSIFVDIKARRNFSGFLLSSLALESGTRVQIR